MSEAALLASKKAAFIDDDPSFLNTMQVWQESVHMEQHTTTDLEDIKRWVEANAVDVVVSDLRMPGADGITVLEEVFEINNGTSLVLLTSFDPNPEERERLGRINAKIYIKTENLRELLDTLSAGVHNTGSDPSLARLAELQSRVALLELMHAEWIEDLLIQLRQIPDPLESFVSTSESNKFSIAELISDIKELKPRGVEHIRLWRRALTRLREMGKKV